MELKGNCSMVCCDPEFGQQEGAWGSEIGERLEPRMTASHPQSEGKPSRSAAVSSLMMGVFSLYAEWPVNLSLRNNPLTKPLVLTG